MKERLGTDRTNGLLLVAAMVGLMWGLEIVDIAADHRLDDYGIHPRDADGLAEIFSAPFLHAGFGHLISNTVPFLAMGAAIALGGLMRIALVTLIVALVSGLGTWLVAASNSIHLGASGVVFGYASYLVSRGSSRGGCRSWPSGWSSSRSGGSGCCRACCRRSGSPGRRICSGLSVGWWRRRFWRGGGRLGRRRVDGAGAAVLRLLIGWLGRRGPGRSCGFEGVGWWGCWRGVRGLRGERVELFMWDMHNSTRPRRRALSEPTAQAAAAPSGVP